MNREFTCPCCGQLTDDPIEILFLDQIPLRPQVIEVIRFLVREYPRAVSSAEIVDFLYTAEKQSELKDPKFNVKVYLSDIRKFVPRCGWLLESVNQGQYRLEKI